MFKCIKKAVLSLGLVVSLSQASHAIPVIEFEFLGSGQVVSPTDTVEMRGRVTNVSNEALVGSVGGGNINFVEPIFSQYFDPFNPPNFAPPGVIGLAPGESIEWLIVNFVPYPITGSLGDPVQLGLYTFFLTDITTTFFVPAGPDSFTVTAQKTNASDFTWTVVEEPIGSVPEPSTLAILGFAVAGLGLAIRRKTKSQLVS